MNSFYVTLPSNAEAGCKTGDFFVRLPQNIAFSDNYEVGLCELSYPHTWNTLQGIHEADSKLLDNQLQLQLKHGESATVTVPLAHYGTVDDLFYGIHRGILDKADKLAQMTKASHKEAVKKKHLKIATRLPRKHMGLGLSKKIRQKALLVLEDVTKRVIFRKPVEIKYIELSRKLQYMMGFKERILRARLNIATDLVDLSAGMGHLYVYSSIVAPQIVGNVMAPLLRVVRAEGHSGDVIEKVYSTPHYVPITAKECNRIDITVCSDSGLPIPFQYGKVIVKLHFRRKSIL
jgi:hypothetical protein